jgi:hypothetical protein
MYITTLAWPRPREEPRRIADHSFLLFSFMCLLPEASRYACFKSPAVSELLWPRPIAVYVATSRLVRAACVKPLASPTYTHLPAMMRLTIANLLPPSAPSYAPGSGSVTLVLFPSFLIELTHGLPICDLCGYAHSQCTSEF